MRPIPLSRFGEFFRGVHGVDPFPWQQRLAAQVLTQGRWPDVLALPTGSGKTAVLDIALFCLAAAPEVFPRRVVLVIDRRVVVDQGATRAQRIAQALASAGAGVLVDVAHNLRAMWGGAADDTPFEIAVLRGGMPRDDAWAKRPDWPVLAVSTVDQVGSRLLFRGYGVSSRMSSVHAGLLGQDTLFLLDEVHLSVPFAETLRALRERWRSFHDQLLPDRWGLVHMSATPGLADEGDRHFGVADTAWSDDEHHEVLRPRLQAAKWARLQPVPVPGRTELDKAAAFAARCAAEAEVLIEKGAATLAVVVNRVATARLVAERLRAGARTEVHLLTGRMRPIDRDAVVQALLPRVQAGRARVAGARPLVVVATQCIEAGADFDFDALVTECASLDALRQRFGRLDRLGELKETFSVILVRADQIGESSDADPIYGEALRATWRWLLAAHDRVDFGSAAMDRRLQSAELAPLLAPRSHAPILLPTHLDVLCQTHPRPWPDPDIPSWLHGPQRGDPEVQLVWRADLTPDALDAEAAESEEVIRDKLAACPPAAAEALSLPIYSVRRWLAEQEETLLADVPVSHSGTTEEERVRSVRPVVCWAGDDTHVIRDGKSIEPGMTLVVPAEYGGIVHGNWEPGAAGLLAVADHGDLVQWRTRKRATLRLDSRTLPAELLVGGPVPTEQDDDDAQALLAKARAWLAVQPPDLPEPWDAMVAALRRKCRVVRHSDASLTLLAPANAGDGVSTEDDGASFIEAEVTLARHSQDVRHWAEVFVKRLGLPEATGRDIVLAAWLHDAGKADPRFQRWLVGGSEIRLALLGEPLAKSKQSVRDRAARERARIQAGYPQGYRHELLSVAMLQTHADLLRQASDADLVLHLVGSHHGWCRPFAPMRDDEGELVARVELAEGPSGLAVTLQADVRHRLARLDSGVADRFWRLTWKYGWWGLAWLEAIVRLADHRASEQTAGVGND